MTWRMNARLTKEIRSLALPALLTAVCAVVVLAQPFLTTRSDDPLHNFASFLFGLAQFGFFAGIIFLAAMSFGVEFQQRTFVLLLSQPAERFRIWRDKMLVLAAIVPAVAVVGMTYYLIGNRSAENGEPGTVALFVLFVVVIVVCSTSFWTLTARSTIGGVVFSAAVMGMGGAGLQALLEKIFGTPVNQTAEAIPRRNFLMAAPMILAGVLYTGTCLWLGWRKFAAMELRDTMAADFVSLPKGFPGAQWFGSMLRCRPTGATRNLIRKEFRLQRPIFMLALLFTAGWLGIWGWSWLFPEQVNRTVAFVALAIIYLLMLAALIGPAAFDEEKTLGLAAWHLTLPPSTRRQWLVKFGVATSVFVLLGICLPLLLPLITGGEAREIALNQLQERKDLAWIPIFGFLFVLGFWAASLTGNMVRGVLTTIFTCFAFGASTPLAIWLTDLLGGLETPLLERVVARFQLSLFSWHWEKYIMILPFILAAVALVQSYLQFRRGQTSTAILIKYAAVLVAVTFAIVFWLNDLAVSHAQLRSLPLAREVTQALRRLPRQEWASSPGQYSLTAADLKRVGELSPLAKQWSRGAKLNLFVSISKDGRRSYNANITVKNRLIAWDWWHEPGQQPAPAQPTKPQESLEKQP